jgi:hypothetical protein
MLKLLFSKGNIVYVRYKCPQKLVCLLCSKNHPSPVLFFALMLVGGSSYFHTFFTVSELFSCVKIFPSVPICDLISLVYPGEADYECMPWGKVEKLRMGGFHFLMER